MFIHFIYLCIYVFVCLLLFCLFRAEMDNPEVSVRFGLMLEAYCRGAPSHMKSLQRQVRMGFVNSPIRRMNYRLNLDFTSWIFPSVLLIPRRLLKWLFFRPVHALLFSAAILKKVITWWQPSLLATVCSTAVTNSSKVASSKEIFSYQFDLARKHEILQQTCKQTVKHLPWSLISLITRS